MTTAADPRDAFDSRHLAVLRAVVEAGSLTRAARRLHVTQPAVTASVQKLEAALGVRLLDRHARGVSPTPAGHTLVAYARRVDATLDALVAEITEREDTLAPLTLGASTTIAAGLVPTLYAAFREQVGDAGLRLTVGNTAEIIDAVREGRLPLALVEGPPRAPGVHQARFVDDSILPVVGAASPVRTTEVDLDARILWREEGSGTRAVVERALRRLGRRPRDGDLELGSTAAITKAAALSLGIAFLSRWSIADELAAGRLRVVSIPELDIRRRFSWVMPSRQLDGTPARFHAFAMANRDALVP